MLSLRAPKVTSYFIKHVDVRSLRVRPGEEGIKVKIGAFAGNALGISTEEMFLGPAAEKIRAYQEKPINVPKYSIERLPAVSKDPTKGESFLNFSAAVSVGFSLVKTIANLHNTEDLTPLIYIIFGVSLYFGTMLFANHRRQLTDNLLHYFVEANPQPVKPE